MVQPDLSASMINDLKTGNAVARIVAGKSRNEPPDRSIPPLTIIHPHSTAQMAREGPDAPPKGSMQVFMQHSAKFKALDLMCLLTRRPPGAVLN